MQPTTYSVMDMTNEERENHFRQMGGHYYEDYIKKKEEGFYNRCHKTDYCKLEQEKREQESKEKEDLIKAQIILVEQRNQILEEHARASEERINSKEKEFAEYIRRADELHNNYKIETDAKIEKLAGLIAQLLKK
jgi:U3 small nucleolar ribonucleoprotein component